MFVLLLSAVLGSMALPRITAALSIDISVKIKCVFYHCSFSDCDVCQLGNYFVPSNGYGCFQLNDNSVACTCPDQQYLLNKPCRRMLFV